MQLSKTRGEDYRVTGYGGWMWLSSSFKSNPRKYKPRPLAVVHSEPSPGQEQKDDESNAPPKPSLPPNTATSSDEQPSDKAAQSPDAEGASQTPSLKEEPSDVASNPLTITAQVQKLVNSCDVIDVSRNLLVRTVLYNVKWQTSKLDKLLRWR